MCLKSVWRAFKERLKSVQRACTEFVKGVSRAFKERLKSVERASKEIVKQF